MNSTTGFPPAASVVAVLMFAWSSTAVAQAAALQDAQLIEAAKGDNIAAVQQLLQEGANTAARDSDGNTALLWAADKGRIDIVKLLLDKGANIEAKDSSGNTVLLGAAYDGKTEMVKLLLKRGANIEADNDIGYTALITAAHEGQAEVVKLLLDKGANIEAKDSDGNTALLHAVTQGQAEVVKLLLDKGANIKVKNNAGRGIYIKNLISLAAQVNPPPVIPEEAQRHYVKACTILEDAKQPSDGANAAEEFKQALLVAPWWGEAYMKMGRALETAQRYDDAIAALNLFMATNPQGEVLHKTEDEISEIEDKAERAVKDKELAKARPRVSRPKAVALPKQNELEDWLKKLDGRRFACGTKGGIAVIDVRGKFLVLGSIDSKGYHESDVEDARVEIQGHETTIPLYDNPQDNGASDTFVISDDGERITMRTHHSSGRKTEHVFLWQR